MLAQSLDGIVSQVNQINDMNFQIATAAGQQSSVAEEMSVNLTNVRELVEASVVVVGELLRDVSAHGNQRARAGR